MKGAVLKPDCSFDGILFLIAPRRKSEIISKRDIVV